MQEQKLESQSATAKKKVTKQGKKMQRMYFMRAAAKNA